MPSRAPPARARPSPSVSPAPEPGIVPGPGSRGGAPRGPEDRFVVKYDSVCVLEGRLSHLAWALGWREPMQARGKT